jgi:hypothetical protein
MKREQIKFLIILKSITDLPDRTLAGEASWGRDGELKKLKLLLNIYSVRRWEL